MGVIIQGGLVEISCLVGEAGKLEKVEAYSFPEIPDEVAAIVLTFKHIKCAISVLEDTDEIELSKNLNLDSLILSNKVLIAHSCVGHELLWCWSMVNNQGYTDALKFEFQNNVKFELVVMVSSLKEYIVSEL